MDLLNPARKPRAVAQQLVLTTRRAEHRAKEKRREMEEQEEEANRRAEQPRVEDEVGQPVDGGVAWGVRLEVISVYILLETDY